MLSGAAEIISVWGASGARQNGTGYSVISVAHFTWALDVICFLNLCDVASLHPALGCSWGTLLSTTDSADR